MWLNNNNNIANMSKKTSQTICIKSLLLLVINPAADVTTPVCSGIASAQSMMYDVLIVFGAGLQRQHGGHSL